MLRQIALLTLFAIAVRAASAAEAAPPLNAATLQLNAGPGQVLSWRTAVRPDAPVLLSASLDRLQASDEWGPLISICLLQTLADLEDVCLRIAPDRTGEIVASVVDFPDDEQRELAHSRAQAIHLERGKPIQVQLKLAAERVEFLVDDKLLHVHESPVMHHGLSLSCSSSLCTLLDVQ